jgi:hypothetical protein
MHYGLTILDCNSPTCCACTVTAHSRGSGPTHTSQIRSCLLPCQTACNHPATIQSASPHSARIPTPSAIQHPPNHYTGQSAIHSTTPPIGPATQQSIHPARQQPPHPARSSECVSRTTPFLPPSLPHTHTHARTHAHTQMHNHTRAHTHTHTHTPGCACCFIHHCSKLRLASGLPRSRIWNI